MVEDLQALMDQYGDTFEITEEGKIKCTLTSHELPHRIEDFKNYVKTKKFERVYGVQQFLAKYGEHFEEIGNNLFGCKLTLRTIAKDPKSLNAHITGSKFKNALKKHQEKLLEEANKPEKAGGDAPTEQVDQEMPSEEDKDQENEEDDDEEKPVKAKSTKASATKRKKVTAAKRNSVKKPRKS